MSDLEKQFALYGGYHRNRVNVFIHLLLVWPFFFSLFILFSFTPPFFTSPQIGFCNHNLVLNFGFLYAVIHVLYYVSLDKKAGCLAGFLSLACWVFGSFLGNYLGFSLAWKVVVATQLFCFAGQFIGHSVFEKRVPSPLDHSLGPDLLAPFFIVLEALQMFFDYEPYPGFSAKVKAMTEAQLKEWQEKKQKKIA